MCNYYYIAQDGLVMPTDGTGPLKRGRIVGRGQGPCKKCSDWCETRLNQTPLPVKEDTPR
jgi:hypothetical protein